MHCAEEADDPRLVEEDPRRVRTEVYDRRPEPPLSVVWRSPFTVRSEIRNRLFHRQQEQLFAVQPGGVIRLCIVSVVIFKRAVCFGCCQNSRLLRQAEARVHCVTVVLRTLPGHRAAQHRIRDQEPGCRSLADYAPLDSAQPDITAVCGLNPVNEAVVRPRVGDRNFLLVFFRFFLACVFFTGRLSIFLGRRLLTFRGRRLTLRIGIRAGFPFRSVCRSLLSFLC